MTNKEKTTRIFEIILEEINGYSKADAQKYAPENEGSETWERIMKVVGSRQKTHSRCDDNPFLLTGYELKRTSDARKAGRPY